MAEQFNEALWEYLSGSLEKDSQLNELLYEYFGKSVGDVTKSEWESLYYLATQGSLLEQLLATGKVVALYDPSDLSSLFTDAGGTISVTTDGDTVGFISDKSQSGSDASQVTGTARPTYHTDGSSHWLTFDGLDDCMSFSEVSSDKILIAVAVRYSVTDATSMVAGHSTANSRIGTFSDQWFGRTNAASSSLLAGTVDLLDNVLLAVSDGVDQNLRVNGQTIASNTVAANDAFFDLLGCTGSEQFFAGRLYGSVIMAGDLTSSEISLVENYLNSKFI